jgi:hypothetical protein
MVLGTTAASTARDACAGITRRRLVAGLSSAAGTAISGVGPASGRIEGSPSVRVIVDPASTSGKQISPYIWGFSGDALCYGRQPVPHGPCDFNTVFDTTFQASAAKLKPTLIRLNTQQTNALFKHIFRNGTAHPDWQWLDNWTNNHSRFFDDATGRLLIGLGPFGADTSISPPTYASWAGPIARYLKDKGQECFWWQVGNECGWADDQGKSTGMGVSDYLAYFDAIADALHAINRDYKVGGPVAPWWDAGSLGAALIQQRTNKIGFVDWHCYATTTGNLNLPVSGIARQTDRAISDAQAARAMMRQAGMSDEVPVGVTEYNYVSWQSGPGTENQTWRGALFNALYLSRCFKGDINFTMAALWDLGGGQAAGDFGAIGPMGISNMTIVPTGHYLGYAGQHMGGTDVPCSTTGPDIDVLASKNGNNFAIQLINTSEETRTIEISLGDSSSTGRITRWSIGRSNPHTPFLSSVDDLGAIRVPSGDIVILSGTFDGRA